MDNDVDGLAAELNAWAARSEREEKDSAEQAAIERARRLADAEVAAARLNDAARAVARAASDDTAETKTTKRFLRSPKVETTRPSSFWLDHVELPPGREFHRISIDVERGFVMVWNDSDARSTGGVTSVVELLSQSPDSARMLQRLLSNFMAKHGLRI